MENVNLKASPETRAQILQLIALEKVANNKDYTIKSYLEYLVERAANGAFGEAGFVAIEETLARVQFYRKHASKALSTNALTDLYEQTQEAMTKTEPAVE
jgi:hypothetical protein